MKTFLLVVLLCASSALAQSALESETPAMKCELCEALVGFAEEKIEAKLTADVVVSEMNKVCSKISNQKLAAACTEFVSKAGPALVDFVEKKITKEFICGELKMCALAALEESDFAAVEAAPEATAKCELCTVLATYAKKAIESIPADQVAAKLKSGCTKLKKLGGVCAAAVDKYAPALIKALEDKANPQEVCNMVKACEPTLATLTPAQKCEVCTTVVGFVKEEVVKHIDEKKVVDALTARCGKLHHLSDVCKDAVTQYGAKMIELVEAKVDEEKICELAKACPAPAFTLQTSPYDKSLKCEACESVMGLVAKEADLHMDHVKIRAKLEAACTHLPAAMANKCHDIIDADGDAIVDSLVQGASFTVVCRGLKLCKGPSQEERCATCQTAAKALETAVGDQSDKALGLLLKICANEPDAETLAACKDVLTHYNNIVFDAIKNGDTKKACQKMHVCPASSLRSTIV